MQNLYIQRPQLTCHRCRATWTQAKDTAPKKCPKCQSFAWNRAAPTLDPKTQTPLQILAELTRQTYPHLVDNLALLDRAIKDCIREGMLTNRLLLVAYNDLGMAVDEGSRLTAPDIRADGPSHFYDTLHAASKAYDRIGDAAKHIAKMLNYAAAVESIQNESHVHGAALLAGALAPDEQLQAQAIEKILQAQETPAPGEITLTPDVTTQLKTDLRLARDQESKDKEKPSELEERRPRDEK